MLVPSIDIIQNDAVQLVGGEEMALNAGSPHKIAEKFGLLGPIAVIDLDAAMGNGDNTETIKSLCKKYRCRVGGGIRSIDKAIDWLDAGAEQIIIGTAATPEFLSQLPKNRLIAALDAKHGEIVVEGWKTKTGKTIVEQMTLLRDHVSGFLVTFVEQEGRMQGTNMDAVQELVKAAGSAKLTIAGGITTAEDIRQLDNLGADAQVGMALYTNRLALADAFAAPLRSDRADGLWTTVVVDEHERALGLCYSNLESLRCAIHEQRGIYWSRRRGLWRKGESSGHRQELLSISMDCDRDCLRFTVRQSGAFCHLNTLSCWGELKGLPSLEKIIHERFHNAPSGSYTKRLLEDPALLAAKLKEETDELIAADAPEEVKWEAADLLYFTMVAMAKAGVSLRDTIQHLEQRQLKVSRRAGHAKAPYLKEEPNK